MPEKSHGSGVLGRDPRDSCRFWSPDVEKVCTVTQFRLGEGGGGGIPLGGIYIHCDRKCCPLAFSLRHLCSFVGPNPNPDEFRFLTSLFGLISRLSVPKMLSMTADVSGWVLQNRGTTVSS